MISNIKALSLAAKHFGYSCHYFDEEKNVVSVEQITPDLDGKFAKDITTGGPLWTQDGIYTVSAQQGESPDHKASVEVEIVDGVVIPEFGTIAALILAVAIMSIIVVSAKSRLSIMPRY